MATVMSNVRPPIFVPNGNVIIHHNSNRRAREQNHGGAFTNTWPNNTIASTSISDLPNEVLAYIFCFFSGISGAIGSRIDRTATPSWSLLCSIPSVCRRWREVCQVELKPIVIDLNTRWANIFVQKSRGSFGLYTILNRFRSVHKIKFCSAITDTELNQLPQSCSNLVHVDLSWCNVSDAGIESLARSCPRLENIDLSSVRVTTAGLVMNFALADSSLRSLTLNYCPLTDAGLQGFGYVFSQLRSVRVSSSDCVTDIWVDKLTKALPHIIELNFANCSNITSVGISRIACNCSNLKVLTLTGCDVVDVDMFALAKECQNLRWVDVAWCPRITLRGFVHLASGCPHLIYIAFSVSSNEHKLNIFHEMTTMCRHLEHIHALNTTYYVISSSVPYEFVMDLKNNIIR